MLADRSLLQSGKRKRDPQFERLESRLILCVTGVLDGEIKQFCVPDLPERAPADVTRAADAVNQFANDLYQHFEAESGNLFLSPLSIATGLAMAYAGAAGETAAEMEEVLHFGSEPGIHDSFRALLEFRSNQANPFNLELANAQWPSVHIAIREEFAQRITNDYGGTSQALDYSRPEEAIDTINSWVTEQTQGTIRDLIEKLSPSTVMVLTNAIYFNSLWAIPFGPGNTTPMTFSRGDGDRVTVPTMYQESAFRYTEHEGYQILELPYREGETSMVILLPGEGQDVDLSPSMLNHVDDWLDNRPEPQEVDVRLPKFKTTVASSLKQVLADMGMPTAFDPGRADFSAMTPSSPWIEKVLHKAFLEVNEQGTEAGAATAVVFEICFVAGTSVLTAEGEKPIEELEPGDRVLARDEHNIEGENELKLVEETFQRTAETVNLHVGGQVIRTTGEHPFFVKGRGWTAARKLEPGDLLATSHYEWIKLEKVVATGEEQPVYNLRVADHHTYFVGGQVWGFAVWAHNRCGGDPPPQFNANRPFHFVIRDNATSATLFMGRISDPLLQEVPTPLEPRGNDPNPNGPQLPGDADRDDDVDFADFLILSANFGKTNAVSADGDFTGDGNVTFEDFLILAANFGNRRIVGEPVAIPKSAATDEFFSWHDAESLLADESLLEDVGSSSRL